MNNIKENKGLFILTLIGVIFFGIFTFFSLKMAFNADYVQIAGLIMGAFFGLITLLFLVLVVCFFTKNDIMSLTLNINMKKWKFIKYFPAFIAIVCFFISVNFYQNREKQDDYAEITLIQTNDSKIQTGGKGSQSIHIETKEYLEYSFKISGIAFKNMYSDYYVNNVKRGDTLVATISKKSYEKKIIKTKSLSFTDKTINYHFIGVYGLKHRNFELLSTKDYESAKKNDSVLGILFFIILGSCFLYLQHKLNKEKKPNR